MNSTSLWIEYLLIPGLAVVSDALTPAEFLVSEHGPENVDAGYTVVYSTVLADPGALSAFLTMAAHAGSPGVQIFPPLIGLAI